MILYVQLHWIRKAGMRETEPKLTQRWPKNGRFSTFFDFRKNCPYDSNEILDSPSTLYYGSLCVISLSSYCWHVRSIAKINAKLAKKQPFFDFFWFSQKLSIRFERNFVQFFYTILWSFVCIFTKLLGCEKRKQNYPKKGQKTAFFSTFFWFLQKLSIRFERKILQSFSTP